MKKLLDSILKTAVDSILKSPDAVLFSENIEETVYNKFKIELPSLVKDELKIDIREEIIGFGNAPDGISFTPGQPMEFALFLIPVKGSKELFKIIVSPFDTDRKIGFDGHYLIYKEFTGRKITGNDSEIQKVKESARSKIAMVESRLRTLEKDIEAFYETSLRPTIHQTIETERRNRRSRSESINKLNPFS
jgi:hypothetical protein